MRATSLEQRLSVLYKQAVHERRWDIAEHLLLAIEACSPSEKEMSDAVAEAYMVAAREMAGEQSLVLRESAR